MTIWCHCFISVLISLLGILRFSSSLNGCSWIAPLTPVAIVMRGLTCHPTVLSGWMSGCISQFFPCVPYLGICHDSM